MHPCQMYDLNFFAAHQTDIRECVSALIDYCLRFDNEPGSCAIVLNSVGQFDLNHDGNISNSPYLVLYMIECRNILARKSLSRITSDYFGHYSIADYYKWCKKWSMMPGISNLQYFYIEHPSCSTMFREQFPEIQELVMRTMYHMFGVACFNSGVWPSQAATMLFQCPECGCFQPLEAAQKKPTKALYHAHNCSLA